MSQKTFEGIVGFLCFIVLCMFATFAVWDDMTRDNYRPCSQEQLKIIEALALFPQYDEIVIGVLEDDFVSVSEYRAIMKKQHWIQQKQIETANEELRLQTKQNIVKELMKD